MRPIRVSGCAKFAARQGWSFQTSTRCFYRLRAGASAPSASCALVHSPRLWQPTKLQRDAAQPIQPAPALPVASTIGSCPGCGGLAQTIEAGEAGFYSYKRKAVRSYIEYVTGTGDKQNEDRVVSKSLENLDAGLRQSIELDDDLNRGRCAIARTVTLR